MKNALLVLASILIVIMVVLRLSLSTIPFELAIFTGLAVVVLIIKYT